MPKIDWVFQVSERFEPTIDSKIIGVLQTWLVIYLIHPNSLTSVWIPYVRAIRAIIGSPSNRIDGIGTWWVKRIRKLGYEKHFAQNYIQILNAKWDWICVNVICKNQMKSNLPVPPIITEIMIHKQTAKLISTFYDEIKFTYATTYKKLLSRCDINVHYWTHCCWHYFLKKNWI